MDKGEVLDSGRNAVLNVIKSDSNMYRYAYARKTDVGWYIASVCKAKKEPLVMRMQMQDKMQVEQRTDQSMIIYPTAPGRR